MRGKNDVLEKAFDMMLDEAALIADEELGRELEEPDEELIFSKEHEEKMEKLFRTERQKHMRAKFLKYSKRAACVFLAVVVVSGAAVMSVEAWRVKFLNFVLDAGAPNTDFDFNDDQSSSYANEIVSLGYIPEGFGIVTNKESSRGLFLEFKNSDKYFCFDLTNINVSASVDTENGTAEKMKINGYEAVFIDNPDTNILIWHDNTYAFDIIGNISKEEIIKIAENVNK